MGKLKIKKQIKQQPLSSVGKNVESLELKIQNGPDGMTKVDSISGTLKKIPHSVFACEIRRTSILIPLSSENTEAERRKGPP